MHPGIGDVEFRPVRAQGLRKGGNIRAIGSHRHTDDMRAVGMQQGVEIEIARIIDQHGVAGADQQTAQQVDRLRTAFGQQDLIGRGFDAPLRHPPRQHLAQRQEAERGAIIRQAVFIVARQRAQGATDIVLRQPVRWQPATAGL